jgi:hypothetical protein
MKKCISGGQKGVDIIAVAVAKRLGFATGGTMARGWRTDEGPHPEYAEAYGMVECKAEGYAVRTLRNVKNADATVVIAENLAVRSGSMLTLRRCREFGKPYYFQAWPIPPEREIEKRQQMAAWLLGYETVNFAGNRAMTGIENLGAWLEIVFQCVREGQREE